MFVHIVHWLDLTTNTTVDTVITMTRACDRQTIIDEFFRRFPKRLGTVEIDNVYACNADQDDEGAWEEIW